VYFCVKIELNGDKTVNLNGRVEECETEEATLIGKHQTNNSALKRV
jgi:hypothetical protein